MSFLTPEATWAIVLLTAILYLLLDGLDLGVGMLQYFLPPDEGLVSISKILPYWNGNEVWLLAFGVSLFALFPQGYATLCSALYIPITLLLFALILRAISISVISDFPNRLCRGTLCISSLAASLMIGFCFGNVLHGLKLNVHFDFIGKLSDLFPKEAIAFSFICPIIFLLYAKAILDIPKKKRGLLILLTILLIATLGVAFIKGIPLVIIPSDGSSPNEVSVTNGIASMTARRVCALYFLIGLPLVAGSIAASRFFLRKKLKRP